MSNFGFLSGYDPKLVQLGIPAGRHFRDDPPTCLIKVRQLAELVAKLIAAHHALYTKDRETFEVTEQQEIVRLIEKAFLWIDRLASETISARKLIDYLDQAVLSKAFRGELVPQDPNDEPASVLLERISAQRRASPSGATNR